jgi:hypothetical protein
MRGGFAAAGSRIRPRWRRPGQGPALSRFPTPRSAVVSPEKLRRYLLIPRLVDDKSRYLARGGFVQTNWQLLETEIRELAAASPAIEDGKNDYGTFWRNEGFLAGPRSTLAVVLVWIEWASDGSFHFVTLKPLKSGKS